MWNVKSALISSVFLFSSLLPEQVNAQATDSCHPKPNPEANQYIVGYGSLMEKDSRTRTTSKISNVKPVFVSGYERVWGKHGRQTTYLGAIAQPDARFNAVAYKLNNLQQLEATDSREDGYCRKQVPKKQLEMLAGSLPNNAQFWIYTLKDGQVNEPNRTHPIVQSYVDIFISGCLEQQKQFNLDGFAQTCIETTTGWSPYWVNDRIYPRRPFIHEPQAKSIDKLLKEQLPRIFEYRAIE